MSLFGKGKRSSQFKLSSPAAKAAAKQKHKEVRTFFLKITSVTAKQTDKPRLCFLCGVGLSRAGPGIAVLHSAVKAAHIATLFQSRLLETAPGVAVSPVSKCQILPTLSIACFHCCYMVHWIRCHFFNHLPTQSGSASWCSSPGSS